MQLSSRGTNHKNGTTRKGVPSPLGHSAASVYLKTKQKRGEASHFCVFPSSARSYPWLLGRKDLSWCLMNTYFANKCISLHLYLTAPLPSPPSLPSTSCISFYLGQLGFKSQSSKIQFFPSQTLWMSDLIWDGEVDTFALSELLDNPDPSSLAKQNPSGAIVAIPVQKPFKTAAMGALCYVANAGKACTETPGKVCCLIWSCCLMCLGAFGWV